ncbi:queuine trna-ribosyltransferase [Fusarium austroafricanum]|uniref:Queuine trna-ribosyltransferase n=1 Tax=Fusarium austroafricanum TaxID=2364996 RepID=A0A8H4K813_9HYPO|nr:queuine trna-ribosyltransferase [Fusarium austroafricanum]
MKGAILSVMASGAAAQITSMPFAALGLGPHEFQNNAINPNDPEYATCQQAVGIVQDCVSSVGGLDAAATADPSALIACACCDGRTNAAPLYSVCSDYLSDEASENTSQYEAYGTLYSACRLNAKCGGSGAATRTGGGGGGSRPTATNDEESATITSATSPASQTYAVACEYMLDIFTSCTAIDKGFTKLPPREQAVCYCCRNGATRQTWTDELGKYASTCAAWARTGEPKTAYPVAKGLATFCEQFTDVCTGGASDATRTADSESSETDQANTTEESGSRQTRASGGNSNDAQTSEQKNNEPVTVTVPAQATETGSGSGSGASSTRVSFGAALVAVAALAIAL